MKWEVVKIRGDDEGVRGKWAVYPPDPEAFYGDWTALCDTWEQAQAVAVALAYGRIAR